MTALLSALLDLSVAAILLGGGFGLGWVVSSARMDAEADVEWPAADLDEWPAILAAVEPEDAS